MWRTNYIFKSFQLFPCKLLSVQFPIIRHVRAFVFAAAQFHSFSNIKWSTALKRVF